MPIARLVLLLAAVFAVALPAPFAAAGDAPAVTKVEVTSDAGADATYARGETIRVTVRFSEAVNVTGAPGLSLDMDPASWGEKRAVYASGSGTAALVFAHEVVEPNYSTQGIAVLADTLALNGGSHPLGVVGGGCELTHAGLSHNAAHKVDWRLSPRHAARRASRRTPTPRRYHAAGGCCGARSTGRRCGSPSARRWTRTRRGAGSWWTWPRSRSRSTSPPPAR